MKSIPFFVILLFNLVSSQNLVFTNNQETIIFKKNELININGRKYLYQKAVKNKTQIHLIKSEFLRKENITIDTSKIETFRTYKVRFSERNALTKGFYGFKKGFTYGGAFGLILGLNWKSKGGPNPSISTKVGFGLGLGVLAGTYIGGYGAIIGLAYGFFSKGESELYNSDNYKVKFDYNENTLINYR